MNCKEVHKELIYFVDNEIDDVKRKQVSDHLDTCSSCSYYAASFKASFEHINSTRVSEIDEFYFTRLEQKIRNKEAKKLAPGYFTFKRAVIVRDLSLSLLIVLAMFAGIALGNFSAQNIEDIQNQEIIADDLGFSFEKNQFILTEETE